VASNFAGVPLAFAFLATLGRTGLLTSSLTTYLGFNIYSPWLQPPEFSSA
jgi:putative spermidine/putrescine transport system permease protein